MKFKKYLLLLYIALIPITIPSLQVNYLHATPPSFLLQQFYDRSRDWIPPHSFIQKSANDTDSRIIANCTRGIVVPDIVGVAYTSDGKTLHDTMWLDRVFEDPSLNLQTKLIITRISLTKDHVSNLLDKFASTKGFLNQTSSGYITSTFNDTSRGISTMLVKEKYPIFYNITFKTSSNRFESYWPEIKRIFNSFDITKSRNYTLAGNFLPYNQYRLGLHMMYPASWDRFDLGNTSTIVRFYPAPLWTEVMFTMTIQDVSFPSYGGLHSDYKLSIGWDFQKKHWVRTLDQISLGTSNQSTVLTKQLESEFIPMPNFANSNSNGGHIDLNLNLSSIGNPNNYVIFSDALSKFKRSSSMFCSLIDLTHWVSLPPPRIRLDVFPNSVNLVPGEEKNMEVRANSSASLPSTVSLNAIQKKDLSLTFLPKNLILPSYGASSSTLRIKASDNLIEEENGSKDVTIPITGDISFPEIITGTGINVSSPVEKMITIQSYLHVTVSNPPSWDEKIGNIFHPLTSALTEFGGAITTIAGIMTTLGIFVGWLLKRKRHKSLHHKNKPKYKTGSPF
ncbi:MAG TPA: hypothetical protein VH500_13435 [Nitrososphaeraceae archaeon]